jgi:hypothetical protein
LVNLLGAYKNGAFFVEQQIKELRSELIEKEGFRIPQMIFPNLEEMESMVK